MEYNNKYRKGTLGWLREQQKVKSKEDGFDNIDNWLRWKADPFNILEKKYGKEFVDWIKQNKNKARNCIINAGCKTEKEYQNYCAKKNGFRDNNEYVKIWTHDNGIHMPMSENEECSAYFGIWIAENYIIKTFEDADKAPYGTIGYDWICNKGMKIECKARCLDSNNTWDYPIGNRRNYNYNMVADYFIISAWDNRESLNPFHVWVFHRDDIVRGEPFWMRMSISISNSEKVLKKFKKFEVTNRLDKLKELCNKR